MTKQEVGRNAREIREKAGLTQNEMAEAVGLTQGAVSRIERGEKVSQETAEAFVSLIAETTPEKLREMARAARKVENEKTDPTTPEPPRPTPPILSAIGRELKAFRNRHRMLNEDVGDVLGISKSYVSQIIRGYLPNSQRVAEFRAAMAKYEGKRPAPVRPVSDKPNAPPPVRPSASGLREILDGTAKAPEAPKPSSKEPTILTPDMVEERVVQPGSKVTGIDGRTLPMPPKTVPTIAPTMQAVEAQGTFLPNGTNLAPHLTLDGKTMHVFTVVPGGVFLSKLTAKENA